MPFGRFKGKPPSIPATNIEIRCGGVDLIEFRGLGPHATLVGRSEPPRAARRWLDLSGQCSFCIDDAVNGAIQNPRQQATNGVSYRVGTTKEPLKRHRRSFEGAGFAARGEIGASIPSGHGRAADPDQLQPLAEERIHRPDVVAFDRRALIDISIRVGMGEKGQSLHASQ